MTDVALKEHLERVIAEHDRRYEQRFTAAEIALTKAELALRDYKVGSNEWRDALKDQSSRMATREELDKVDRGLQQLQRDKANLDGKLLVASAVTAALFGIIASIAVQFLFA